MVQTNSVSAENMQERKDVVAELLEDGEATGIEEEWSDPTQEVVQIERPFARPYTGYRPAELLLEFLRMLRVENGV